MTLEPHLGPYAITDTEHDAIVARRGRSVTDGPIRKHKDISDTAPGGQSLLDQYIAKEAGE